MKKFVCSTLLAFAVALIFVACGSTPKKNEAGMNVPIPEWAKESVSGLICAVGIEAYDEELGQELGVAKDWAVDGGYLELAKNIAREVGDLVENYRGKKKIGKNGEFERNTKEIIEQIAHGTIRRSEVQKWDQYGKNVFARVCVNPKKYMEAYKGAIDENQGLDKEAKDALEATTEEMVKKLESKVTMGERNKEKDLNDAIKEAVNDIVVQLPEGSKE